MSKEDREKSVWAIEFNRPPVNAFDLKALDELSAEIQRAFASNARAVSFTGSGDVFSAGLDTKAMEDGASTDRRAYVDGLTRLVGSIAKSPIPCVAAISGHCLGAGAAIAAVCDMRIATEGSYRVGFPEVAIGIDISRRIFGAVARLVGTQFAQRMCVEALVIGPSEAHDRGFFDMLVPASELRECSSTWLDALLKLPRENMLSTRNNARADLVSLYDGQSRDVSRSRH